MPYAVRNLAYFLPLPNTILWLLACWLLPIYYRQAFSDLTTQKEVLNGQFWCVEAVLTEHNFFEGHHRVLRGLFTYPKNIRTLKNGFFGAKPYGEQRLLKAFCPLWENPANLFEKKPFGLLNKVPEGR